MTNEIDRFGKCAVLKLNTDGFENLPLDQKHLVYHLSQAGLYGRDIFFQQNYKYNLVVRDVLETIYVNLDLEKLASEEHLFKFEQYLKEFWFHVGIYDSFSNKRLDVPFSYDDFYSAYKHAGDYKLDISDERYELVRKVLFDLTFTKEYKNIQQDGVDVVAESGGNFYEGMTHAEIEAVRVLKPDFLPATEGFNVRISKDEDNVIRYEHIFEGGLYGEEIVNIMKHLEHAVLYAENDQQKLSIESLIKFYKTGQASDFESHSVEWTKDHESNVYFINGLIESYDDPLGVGCTFESIVAFKNPEQTAKVEKIIDNIQWFEDNLPFDKRFKKTEAAGLSASSITVASMAGATSPTLPLGICLPNADWIREKHGSKSVNLANVHNARGEGDGLMRKEFFLPEYQDMLKKYNSVSGSLHTDLHEVAGHGSGRLLEGTNPDGLGIYSAVIEEARADLVGLFYVGDKKLQEFGIVDADVDMYSFAKAQYVSYLTNGSMVQLRRVDAGADLAQPHLRNRQIVANWVLKEAELVAEADVMQDTDGKHYIRVNDVEGCRVLFGELLCEIQRIKSEGDFEAAKSLVEQYGTKVDQAVHKEVLERVEVINPPSLTGFTTPVFERVTDENCVVDYTLTQFDNFVDDQLYLSRKYSV